MLLMVPIRVTVSSLDFYFFKLRMFKELSMTGKIMFTTFSHNPTVKVLNCPLKVIWRTLNECSLSCWSSKNTSFVSNKCQRQHCANLFSCEMAWTFICGCGGLQVDALRLRLEEKESFLNKKTKQLQDLTEEKGTLAGEIRDMKDMLEVKERKINVLQKKVRVEEDASLPLSF